MSHVNLESVDWNKRMEIESKMEDINEQIFDLNRDRLAIFDEITDYVIGDINKDFLYGEQCRKCNRTIINPELTFIEKNGAYRYNIVCQSCISRGKLNKRSETDEIAREKIQLIESNIHKYIKPKNCKCYTCTL